ncbi:MAG: hypothetical protein Q9169_000495 [Polycauliona sp. 2 TL-2023]
MAAVNGAGGGMPMMNNGANGATPRLGNEEEEPAIETRLNTYIYDYFVKNQRYDCAKAMLKCEIPLKTTKRKHDGDINGAGSMHTDSKDDLESKFPDDFPLPALPASPQGTSFLSEWFGLFWDVFFAHQRNTSQTSAQAMQYVARTQHESRIRQEQQQNMLRVPGMMPAGMNGMNGMNDYHNMMYRQQNGMPVGDLRQKALQNQNRNFAQYACSLLSVPKPSLIPFRNPQMMTMQQKQLMQQHMRRDPSEMEMNGQRPRTPSSGDNAPSPSKRPRMEGHPGMMMQNGRPQPMMDQANNSPNALMMQGGAPGNMTEAQLMAFNQQPYQVQQKSLDVFNQNLKISQQRQNMSKPGMPGQGSPMLPPNMDMGAVNPEFYGPPNMRMAAGMPNGAAANGNHALQDYQMQLMLLEQQNKKRLLMARQEQDIPREGQPGMPGGNFGGPPGMSPSGSRSGPSPGPNDQVKRGTPNLAQAGLPGSPMPDGSMGPSRGSPANSMSMGNGMQNDMFPMKTMSDGMTVMAPNGNLMRQAPSSHPNFGNGGFTPQQVAAEMQRRGAAMPNGNWPPGPQGQAPMMPQQPPPQVQQPPPMGTPQQRGNMPPPPGVPAGTAVNGRPGSPAQPAAPPTPSQGSKANPKTKKDAKDRKKPTKKNSTAGAVTAATPSSEAENPPPTPTPPTPIISVHPNSFNGQKGSEGQNPTAVAQVPAPAGPAVEQAQPEANGMDVYGMTDGDVSASLAPLMRQDLAMGHRADWTRQLPAAFDMTFGDFNSNQHLEQFDFDSFLQDSIMDPEQFPFENGAEAIGGS